MNKKKVVKKKVKKSVKKKMPVYKGKTVDWRKVDQMLHIQCTGEEIASVLDIDYDTLQNHCKKEHKCPFSEYSAIKREGGKASLRRNQWKMSEKNPAMAIFLGKNLLGQKDKQDVEHTGEVKVKDAFDISKLSTPELKRLKELQEKMK